MSGAAPRRRDAEENRQRILEVALVLLTETPNASMADLARAAGVARRTVYGHFASREALTEAIATGAQKDLARVIDDADRNGETPAERYALFVTRAWRDRDRLHALLMIGRNELGPDGVRTVMAPINARVAEFAAAAQRDGTFASQLPVPALAAVLQALNLTLLDEAGRGHWDGDPAHAALACLIAAGMDHQAAQLLVDQITTREPASERPASKPGAPTER